MIRAGQKYRAIEPVNVVAFSSWRAPATYGLRGTLAKDEVFTIDNGPQSEAIVVHCSPENNHMLHAVFISESNRSSAKYRHYYLSIAVTDVFEKCERLPDDLNISS